MTAPFSSLLSPFRRGCALTVKDFAGVQGAQLAAKDTFHQRSRRSQNGKAYLYRVLQRNVGRQRAVFCSANRLGLEFRGYWSSA